jgi:hypothetical protein
MIEFSLITLIFSIDISELFYNAELKQVPKKKLV